jgi:hypothetical protein
VLGPTHNVPNEAGEVVGGAAIPVPCSGSNPPRHVGHAFLWKNGVIMDLGTVAGTRNSGANFAGFIDDLGEIGAFGVLPNDDSHAVLLIPCDEEHSDNEGCEDNPESATGEVSQRPRVVLPENVSKMLRQRLGQRYHIPGLGAPKD